MYGLAQKEQMGFDKAVEECKYRMSRYGVQPNMLILPPQMLLYMALAPETKLLYKEGGPNAEARFEAGVAGIEAKAFRGCGVFTSEPFEVSDDQDSVQMLTRSTQVGEFYIMQPPQVTVKSGEPAKFTCDMLIYDEESDRHVRIEWKDALDACCVNVENATDAGKIPGDTKLANPPEVALEKASEWLKQATAVKDFNEGNEDAKLDVRSRAVRIVVVRPFIEHLMHSAILAVSGRDTGATLFGPADMQLSANTQVKTIEGAQPCISRTFPCTHLYSRGTLPHTHSGRTTVSGILWMVKDKAGRGSVSLRGILPKGRR